MKYATKAQRAKFHPYDSQFEKDLAEGVLKDVDYHPDVIQYTKPSTTHKYEPDFKIIKDDVTIYVEAKGRFTDAAEAKKYLYVRDSLEDTEELVFLFMNPNTPMPAAKKRKDGSIRTNREFAESKGFRWFTKDTIEELL